MARRIDMHRRPTKTPASSYQKSERHPKNPGDRVRGRGAPFGVTLLYVGRIAPLDADGRGEIDVCHPSPQALTRSRVPAPERPIRRA